MTEGFKRDMCPSLERSLWGACRVELSHFGFNVKRMLGVIALCEAPCLRRFYSCLNKSGTFVLSCCSFRAGLLISFTSSTCRVCHMSQSERLLVVVQFAFLLGFKNCSCTEGSSKTLASRSAGNNKQMRLLDTHLHNSSIASQ